MLTLDSLPNMYRKQIVCAVKNATSLYVEVYKHNKFELCVWCVFISLLAKIGSLKIE
jgi:hypothetical protein